MRILFVAMADSIHTARWINQIADQRWDVHLFPVEDHGLHPALRNITVHETLYPRSRDLHPSVRVADDVFPFLRNEWLPRRGAAWARRGLKRFNPRLMNRARRLAHLIRRLQPDIIHSLCMHDPGYLVWQAKQELRSPLPTWIVANWGSDISLFGRLAAYQERIRSILSACDYYTCECHRDRELARAFGFAGEFLPVLPIAGGYDISSLPALASGQQPSQRRLVVVKGYQNMQGRAFVALRALELCAEVLRGYRVAIFSTGWEVQTVAELVKQASGLPIDIVSPSSHDEMMQLHGRARVSVGLSISDGISTSLLEAMLMGSFPIQSNTSCACEWIQEGETGLLVHPDEPQQVAAALRRALTDDRLVDRAAQVNAEVAARRLDRAVVQPHVVAMYEQVYADARARPSPQ